MAISFTQNPQLYNPAYNRNQFVAFSTLAAANNDFVYRVEVLTPAGLMTYDYPKRPDNYGVFHVDSAVANAIRHSFDADSKLPTLAPGKSIGVSVTVTEVFGGTTHGQASYDYIAFDACLLKDVYKSYDFKDYVSGYTSPILFLSPRLDDPLNPQGSVTTDTDVWLTFYLGACVQIDLQITDDLGAPVGTLNFPISSPQPNEIYYFNVGNRTTIAGGFALANGYTVLVVFKGAAANVLFTLSYTIEERCSKFDRYTVYYLKRNGAIGFFTFDKKSQASVKNTTSQVRNSRMALDSSHHYTYNTFDREAHTVSTLITTKTVLNTDWITDAQSQELAELFDSPIRWISPPGNWSGALANYIPVTITDTDYDVNKTVNQKLFNYTITTEHSQQEGRQRGI